MCQICCLQFWPPSKHTIERAVSSQLSQLCLDFSLRLRCWWHETQNPLPPVVELVPHAKRVSRAAQTDLPVSADAWEKHVSFLLQKSYEAAFRPARGQIGEYP